MTEKRDHRIHIRVSEEEKKQLEAVSQMRENAETLNQIAARVNSTGHIYPSNLAQIAQDQQKVLKTMKLYL